MKSFIFKYVSSGFLRWLSELLEISIFLNWNCITILFLSKIEDFCSDLCKGITNFSKYIEIGKYLANSLFKTRPQLACSLVAFTFLCVSKTKVQNKAVRTPTHYEKLCNGPRWFNRWNSLHCHRFFSLSLHNYMIFSQEISLSRELGQICQKIHFPSLIFTGVRIHVHLKPSPMQLSISYRFLCENRKLRNTCLLRLFSYLNTNWAVLSLNWQHRCLFVSSCKCFISKGCAELN